MTKGIREILENLNLRIINIRLSKKSLKETLEKETEYIDQALQEIKELIPKKKENKGRMPFYKPIFIDGYNQHYDDALKSMGLEE